MVQINPETQKTRRERLATVIAVGASALFHIFLFIGGVQFYRWVEEEEKREQLMVIRRVQEPAPDAASPAPPAPRRRPSPPDSRVKEKGPEPPAESGGGPDAPLPGDLPAEDLEEVEEVETEEVTETTLLVRTDLREATFTLSGPLEIHGSGTALVRKGIPPGEYTATFHPVHGYRTPPISRKTLPEQGRVVFTGRYSKSIEVSVRLNEIPGAGFEILRPDGRPLPMDRAGTVLFDNLPEGSYTIVFREVPGYLTPAPQSRTLIAGGASLSFTGSYLPGGTGAKAKTREVPSLDRRVQMVVKSYPPTSIEHDFDYIRYPGLIFTRRNFQQGWCRVYLVVETDWKGQISRVHVERPEPEDREQFTELIEAVRQSVSSWRFERTRAEVHVDVRFYVE